MELQPATYDADVKEAAAEALEKIDQSLSL